MTFFVSLFRFSHRSQSARRGEPEGDHDHGAVRLAGEGATGQEAKQDRDDLPVQEYQKEEGSDAQGSPALRTAGGECL